MAVEVRPLWGTFGAEVTGFELGRPQPAEAWRAVVAAGHRHGVIVLHGQATDEAGLVRFASAFGLPAIHVLAHFHVPGHPAILKLSNIVTGGEPWGLYDGANYWHTDMSYEDPPGAATVVHALKTPASGGGTRVADMHAAYDDLPDATKRRIEGLVVVHRYGNRDDLDEASATSAGKLEVTSAPRSAPFTISSSARIRRPAARRSTRSRAARWASSAWLTTRRWRSCASWPRTAPPSATPGPCATRRAISPCGTTAARSMRPSPWRRSIRRTMPTRGCSGA